MGTRVHICGRLEVEWDGEQLEEALRGRQSRLLFAYLTLHRDRPVRRAELIEALWSGAVPPSDGDALLRPLLSRLRRALGPDRLEGRAELALRFPAETWIDWESVRSGVQEARARYAAGDPAAAWDAAAAALAIAERDVLPGLEADWIERFRTELEEHRCELLETVALAGARLGHAKLLQAEQAARRAVELSPYRESARLALMEVLRRRGNVAEALVAYDEIRSLLRDELGSLPGPELRALHDALLRAETAAPPPPPPATCVTGEWPSGDREARRGVALGQEIRFCDVDGARVAYAMVGSGPGLLLPALWISHVELEWGFSEFRAFIGALGRRRTVIRYDRLGTGLSDRPTGAVGPTVEAEVRTVAALVEALGLEEVSLLGISWGGCTAAAFAARHPERVRCLALVGAYAHGERIAPGRLREAMVATVRAHWGAGSRLLADVWVPGADADTRERFARLQRAAASPEVAAAMLEAVYRTDIRDVLPRVGVPALVVHRREDRAMPFAQGREVAALLPHARLVALDGDLHPPWLGDSDAVLGALTTFLDAQHPARAMPAAADGPLSEREREVLQLVADGLSDAEIARRLIVSPHTVHRHVANIRTKLRQPSRAAAAAYAAREGLI